MKTLLIVMLLLALGCQIEVVNPPTETLVTVEGGTFGGSVEVLNYSKDSVKAQSVKIFEVPLGDTVIFTSYHNSEVHSIIASRDTSVYLDDILHYSVFF